MNFEKVLTADIKKIGCVFKKHGFDLRVVGGSVRDVLLGQDPKDIDLCSNATPKEMVKFLEAEGYKTYPTGIDHGTISVKGRNELYEITTLRIDVETDGRHAEVEFTRSFKEDAARRDFTINAMSIDMNGNLYDYFGGHSDLKNNQIKFVGNANCRIKEDYLRILRYFRFVGRVKNPKPDPEARKAISNNANGLKNISGERIWMEISKILKGKNVKNILYYMDIWSVSENICFPFWLGEIDSDEYEKIDQLAYNLDPITFLAFFTDSSEDMKRTIDRWKISRRAEIKISTSLS